MSLNFLEEKDLYGLRGFFETIDSSCSEKDRRFLISILKMPHFYTIMRQEFYLKYIDKYKTPWADFRIQMMQNCLKTIVSIEEVLQNIKSSDNTLAVQFILKRKLTDAYDTYTGHQAFPVYSDFKRYADLLDARDCINLNSEQIQKLEELSGKVNHFGITDCQHIYANRWLEIFKRQYKTL